MRLGTPAGTTRGFGDAEFREIGKLIVEVLDGLKAPIPTKATPRSRRRCASKVASRSTERFPIYCYGLTGTDALSLLRQSEDTQVKDSRPAEDGAAIRRRRVCPDCGGRFTTFERVQLRDSSW